MKESNSHFNFTASTRSQRLTGTHGFDFQNYKPILKYLGICIPRGAYGQRGTVTDMTVGSSRTTPGTRRNHIISHPSVQKTDRKVSVGSSRAGPRITTRVVNPHLKIYYLCPPSSRGCFHSRDTAINHLRLHYPVSTSA